MDVLERCSVPARYRYLGGTRKQDRLVIRNADDLYANLPVGAAKLEGKLERSGQLTVASGGALSITPSADTEPSASAITRSMTKRCIAKRPSRRILLRSQRRLPVWSVCTWRPAIACSRDRPWPRSKR